MTATERREPGGNETECPELGGSDLDVAGLRDTANDWYEFGGDPDRDLPPYWVVRHGWTVATQIGGADVEVWELDSVARARAVFAEQTCDPDGPGAPQPGDLIEILWGADQGERFIVTGVATYRHPGGWLEFTVTGDTGAGRPRVLAFAQYEIVERLP